MHTLVYPQTSDGVSLFDVIQAVVGTSRGKAGIIFTAKKDALVSLRTDSGDTFEGMMTCLRYAARVLNLYAPDISSQTAIDQFVELSFTRLTDKSQLNDVLADLNHRLAMRTFLVGYSVSIGDLAVWHSLSANELFQSTVKKPQSLPHLSRWFDFFKAHPEISKLFTKTTTKSLLSLPSAVQGEVVTRFPPEPSGYLHIGHAKAAILNDMYARMYDGRMILRFDDTNPDKEEDDFVQSIIADLKLLGVKHDGPITHSSDHFDTLIEFCTKLIKQGDAYADDTDVDVIRDERLNCVESKNRSNSIEKNLHLWEEMQKGTEKGLKCIIRAKIDMQSKNGCMRDPTLYRCNLTPHHRVGDKYKVYPTYDFCCPIVDSIEGVTHALRTTEYLDRNPQYYWIISKLSLRRPIIGDYSRVNFVYTLLSKRKLKWFVDNGFVEGWDDPRFPTVRGIHRRGLLIEALREFVETIGASRSTNLMDWSKLWNFNKKHIDKSSYRFTAVTDHDKVKVVMEDLARPNISFCDTAEINLHPKRPELGTKKVTRSSAIYIEQLDASECEVNEEVTLIGWGNAIIKSIENVNGKVISMRAELNLKGSVKTTKKKLTWVSAVESSKPLEAELVDLGYLISVPSIEPGVAFEDVLVPKEETWTTTKVVCESAMASVKKGQIIQINRRGFFKCDQIHSDGRMVLFFIPDGRTKAASKIA